MTQNRIFLSQLKLIKFLIIKKAKHHRKLGGAIQLTKEKSTGFFMQNVVQKTLKYIIDFLNSIIQNQIIF